MNASSPRKPRLALAEVAPPPDAAAIPEHIARLHAAIASQHKAAETLARLEEAASWEGAGGCVAIAHERVREAEVALQSAARYEADRVIADATGGSPPEKELTIREAR